MTRPELSDMPLLPHPASPPSGPIAVSAGVIGMRDGWLLLRWRIAGARGVAVPPLAGRGRADGLWQATCFELFARAEGAEGYAEFNFSPSERWAAYDFTGYREGVAPRALPRPPRCTWRHAATAIFDAALPLAALPPAPFAFGLTAVIEETDGTKSYWALAHGADRPDFHDPACFAARLPAANAP